MADNDIFMSSRWFSPYISSAEMEAKMKGEEYAGKDGVFGVRVSKSNPSLVLSSYVHSRNGGSFERVSSPFASSQKLSTFTFAMVAKVARMAKCFCHSRYFVHGGKDGENADICKYFCHIFSSLNIYISVFDMIAKVAKMLILTKIFAFLAILLSWQKFCKLRSSPFLSFKSRWQKWR
jgi:hypothetical protein